MKAKSTGQRANEAYRKIMEENMRGSKIIMEHHARMSRLARVEFDLRSQMLVELDAAKEAGG